MLYLAYPTLLRWWGVTWIVVLGSLLTLVLVVIPTMYRVIRGKWSKLYLYLFGGGIGCFGLIILSLFCLSYPIAYRLVEGAWPISYLIAQSTLVVVGLLQNGFETLVSPKSDEI